MDSFEKVAKEYSPLIYKIIHSLKIYKECDHYYSVGLQALWEAYMKYEEGKASFLTFAFVTIRGRLLIELTKESKWESRNQRMSPEQFEFMECQRYSEIYLEKEVIDEYCLLLTDNQKRWVVHTFLEQKSLSEIAELYGVSISAVKSWRRDALQKLRKVNKE
ncbi:MULTISPECIES: sigma-70 family RNA polymerase sigma factor [Bacillus]|uniref:sigma-70 family RNA polymerase sigma factor n=1 Tax=Bacillus TaxID=1386 RepID=UPI0002DB03C2|nr:MULTISPECIES: sigma-70 family RNA polymerase sigma factor [Bacillus]